MFYVSHKVLKKITDKISVDMKNLKWYLEFYTHLNNFESEYNQSHSPLSPLGYALKLNKIPKNDYLTWAQKTYNLPIVTDDYFKSNLPSLEDWKTWKNEYKWSEEICPLAIWDGHVLIACLEIPLNFPASLYPIFVLSSFQNIERTFEYYVNSERGANSVQKNNSQLNYQLNSSSTDNLFEDNIENMGFSLDELSENPNPTDSSDNELGNLEIPDLINEKELFANSRVDFKNLLNATQSKINVNSQTDDLELSKSHFNINTNSSADIKLENTSLTQTKFGNTGLNLKISPTMELEMAKGMPLLVALKKEFTEHFELSTQNFFTQNMSLYNKFMLISVDPAERVAIPVSWSDQINPNKSEIEPIDLSQASIFKIVATTLKPYHGYVVLNETNEKFFDFWNQSHIPSNITLIPIIIKNKLVGMLMAMGELNTYSWTHLKNIELKSMDLIKSISLISDNKIAS